MEKKQGLKSSFFSGNPLVDLQKPHKGVVYTTSAFLGGAIGEFKVALGSRLPLISTPEKIYSKSYSNGGQ